MNVTHDRWHNDIAGDDVDLAEKYEIGRCVDWISKNHYRKICLQFPDELLGDAVGVTRLLGMRVDAELFVSADATFRSCCLDLKTAKHVNADALIHFGRTCSSRFYSDCTASLFILPKEILNVDAVVESVTRFVKEKKINVVLLYDIAFAHYTNQLSAKLSAFRSTISVSRLLAAAGDPINLQERRKDGENGTFVEKFGRQYCVDFGDYDGNVAYVYIISTSGRKNFENFLLSLPDSIFYSYDSRADALREESVPKSIKKTLFRVEKVKEARRIGILVATLEAHSFLVSVRRIKKLCAANNKKTYIISVGKLNVAKLANFPEIDLFVMISCAEVEILDRKDYFQTIVSTMEVELALNENHRWAGKFVADFSEFLPGGSEYVPANENDSGSQEGDNIDVSLLNNRLIGFDKANEGCVAASILEPYGCRTSSGVLRVDDSSSHYDLANRSWTGLRMKDDQPTPVSEATVGRKGTPAAGYKTAFSDHVT